MAIKKYNPTSPARRNMTVSTFEEITKTEPEKSLVEILKNKAGRNNYGKITVRHQGGGHKRQYRIIDFKRDKVDIPAKVSGTSSKVSSRITSNSGRYTWVFRCISSSLIRKKP